jgi:segregation and condensation protein A
MTDQPTNPVPAPAETSGNAQYEKTAHDLKKEEASVFPFSVSVATVYDGPLDLLLDLIRKQDIDIYDIPIAKITAQFLGYVEHLKETDVDVAGDFIYTAALLIHIKSKMLLPRSPAETAEGEADDPRRELVERLLEHERFKNAAQMLHAKQQIEEATWTNPGIREFRDTEGTEPEIAADTMDLVRVFQEILNRAKSRPILEVEEDAATVGQMIDFVRRRLVMEDKPIALSKLLRGTRSRSSVIAMFLALLELVRLQAILLRQDRNFSEVFVKKHEQFEEALNERMSQIRDDWS